MRDLGWPVRDPGVRFRPPAWAFPHIWRSPLIQEAGSVCIDVHARQTIRLISRPSRVSWIECAGRLRLVIRAPIQRDGPPGLPDAL
jgi:hypothetical protein